MKEPQDATLVSARLARAFPSLSAYSAAVLAEELCTIERAQRRHAERCCNGEDGGYVKREYHALRKTMVACHDPDAQERTGKRIDARCMEWESKLRERVGNTAFPHATGRMLAEVKIQLEGDPRGAVLKLRLPGEAEAVAV